MPRMTALLLLVAACGGGDTTARPTPTTSSPEPLPVASGPPEIRASDNSFSPRSLTVAVGTKVTVRSAGSNPHTWTHEPDFDVALDERGATGSFTFTKAGSYDFLCRIHESQGMTGVVTVT